MSKMAVLCIVIGNVQPNIEFALFVLHDQWASGLME